MRKQVYLPILLLVIAALFIAGCSSQQAAPTSPSTSAAPKPAATTNLPGIQIFISYDGAWQGAVGIGSNIKSIAGAGDMMYDVTFPPGTSFKFVSVNAQKQDGSTDRLRVNIRNKGSLVATEYTEAPYGVAMTSYQF